MLDGLNRQNMSFAKNMCFPYHIDPPLHCRVDRLLRACHATCETPRQSYATHWLLACALVRVRNQQLKKG